MNGSRLCGRCMESRFDRCLMSWCFSDTDSGEFICFVIFERKNSFFFPVFECAQDISFGILQKVCHLRDIRKLLRDILITEKKKIDFYIFSVRRYHIMIDKVILHDRYVIVGMIAQNKCTHNFRFLSFLTLFIITSSQIVKKNFLTEIFVITNKISQILEKIRLLTGLPQWLQHLRHPL